MMLKEEDTKKEPSEVLEPMLLLDFLKNFKMETNRFGAYGKYKPRLIMGRVPS